VVQGLNQLTKDFNKIDQVAEGLSPYIGRHLKSISRNNAATICEYISAQIHEINPGLNYKSNMMTTLIQLSVKLNNKPFEKMDKEDILEYLESFRKPENEDLLHKWIGSYNESRQRLVKFFRWLYNPDVKAADRTTPEVINIAKLKRKETAGNKSCVKPSDLWTKEEDLLFLKYCHRKMDKCYHTMSRDASTRVHELVDVRRKDIVFKIKGGRQIAEIMINGKTGTRTIPLIDSVPYVKDWLDDHPQQNPDSYLFISLADRCFGKKQTRQGIYTIYSRYKNGLFTELLKNPTVPQADKDKIQELLKKPWHPYIRRHTALTEKSRILKTSMLKQHAGWSPNSTMNLKYEHWFGNESNESIYEAYGIVDKDKAKDILQPKQCPNCSEPNKPDSKFCAKCRMVLTYDAYSETLEDQKELQNIKKWMEGLGPQLDRIERLERELGELRGKALE